MLWRYFSKKHNREIFRKLVQSWWPPWKSFGLEKFSFCTEAAHIGLMVGGRSLQPMEGLEAVIFLHQAQTNIAFGAHPDGPYWVPLRVAFGTAPMELVLVGCWLEASSLIVSETLGFWPFISSLMRCVELPVFLTAGSSTRADSSTARRNFLLLSVCTASWHICLCKMNAFESITSTKWKNNLKYLFCSCGRPSSTKIIDEHINPPLF